MAVLFYIFLFTSVALIISKRGSSRAIILIYSILFLNDAIYIPPYNSYIILLIAFVLSLIKHQEINKAWKEYPFQILTILLLTVHFLVAILDTSLSPIKMINRVITTFTPTYLAFFIGYSMCKNSLSYKKFLNSMLPAFFIMGIYGILTYIIQSNPYYDMLHKAFGNEEGIWSEVQTRGYRVLSTLSNPIVYGAFAGMVSLLLFHERRFLDTKFPKFLIFIMVLNVFLANSRTSTASVLLLFGIYFIFSKEFNLAKKTKQLIFIITILIVLYQYIPYVTNAIDSLYDVLLTGGANTEGSSTELKENQWLAALYYFSQHPFFGNGFYYFNEHILQQGAGGGYADMIAGMEGYIYKMMVEQGGVMICIVVSFFIQMGLLIMKNKKSRYSILCISILLSFLFFICATGTYGGVFTIFALFIGCLVKQLKFNN